MIAVDTSTNPNVRLNFRFDCKAGSRKMGQSITTPVECAGIAAGKASLDIAVTSEKRSWRVANTAAGCAKVIKALNEKGIGKVGLEAPGGLKSRKARAMDAA